ncbi:unnamed protein product, partial [Brenthis ino]
MRYIGFLLFVTFILVQGKLENEDEDTGESDGDDSEERIGAAVTQVLKHPYSAALLKNETYVCSAVILNTYWLLTLSKCFNT